MTTKYLEYLGAYDKKIIDLENVNINVKLVLDSYVPDPSHKPSDVQDYILAAVDVITKNDIKRLTMGELVELCQSAFEEGLLLDPELIIGQVEEDKKEFFREALQLQPGRPFDWMKMKELGVKYFVVEYSEEDILCWCEEII